MIIILGGAAGYGENFRDLIPFSGDASRDVQALWVPDLYMEERLEAIPLKDRLSMWDDSALESSVFPLDVGCIASGRRRTGAI